MDFFKDLKILDKEKYGTVFPDYFLLKDRFDLFIDLLNKGELSDGYHTFNELYYHRAILFSIICNQNKELAWKSKLHANNTMYDGMFIVGISTPEGQYSYHYNLDLWDLFKVKELDNAPAWDGHLPKDIDRLFSIVNRPLRWEDIKINSYIYNKETDDLIHVHSKQEDKDNKYLLVDCGFGSVIFLLFKENQFYKEKPE